MITELPERFGKYWEELLTIAESIYEEEERYVDLPLEDKSVLQEMIGKRLVESEEVGVTIREDLLPGTIAWHLLERAVSTWEELEEWTRFLREIHHKEWGIFRDHRRIGSDLLILLQKEKGLDVLQRAHILAETDLERDELQASKYGAMSYALYDALPKLDIELGELIAFLKMAQQATAGVIQLGVSSLQRVVADLCSERPELGENVYDALLTQADEDAQVFISSALEGLADHNFDQAFERAFELSKSDDAGKVRAGAIALGILAIREEAEKKQWNQVWSRLAELQQYAEGIVGEAVIIAYRQLWEFDEEKAIAKIDELSHRDQPRIQRQILRILRVEDERSEEDWYRRMLSKLASVRVQHAGLTNELDLLLMSLVDDDPDFVSSFLGSWVKQNPGSPQRTSIDEVFDSTIGQLCREGSAVLEAYITRWLADDPKVQQAAANIVWGVRHRERKWSLAKEVMDEMNIGDLRFLAFKVAGRVAWGPVQGRLLMSMLRREPEEEELTSLVQEVMTDYVGYNFPGATEDLLEELKEKGNEVQRKVAAEVIRSMEASFNNLRERPDLTELRPPSPRVELFRRAQRKQFKIGWDAVRQGSPIFGLFRNVQVRAGSGTYMNTTGGSERMPFNRISTSQEVDRGESIDPVRQAWLRLQWLSYERPNDESADSKDGQEANGNE